VHAGDGSRDGGGVRRAEKLGKELRHLHGGCMGQGKCKEYSWFELKDHFCLFVEFPFKNKGS